MTKSSLDNIDGIGQKKKQELLKAFGSVENIEQATEEELMKVKGISQTIARRLRKD